MRQSKLKKKLLVLVTIGSLLLPSIAKANEDFYIQSMEGPLVAVVSNDTVKECVAKCDTALAAQDKVIDLKTRQIEVQKDIIAAQDVRVTQLEKEKGGLLRSPWFYFAIGVVAGGLIMKGR